jgi:GAF domain-containing protein
LKGWRFRTGALALENRRYRGLCSGRYPNIERGRRTRPRARLRRNVFVPKPSTSSTGISKPELYRQLASQLSALFADESDGLANTANMAALLFDSLPELNWLGFYFLRGSELVLGPFQGKVACVRIALGRGVCGTAARERKTIVVSDVHAFPGHIACDPASRSEIVVPLIVRERLLGVLDLDSPRESRFDAEDAAGLEAALELLLRSSDLSRLTD